MRARCLTALSTLTLLVLGLAWLATPAFAAPAAKVQLCHIPPGNPDGFHTITISDNARRRPPMGLTITPHTRTLSGNAAWMPYPRCST